MTRSTNQEQINLFVFIREEAIPFLSFSGLLSIFLSISYHFSYFVSIDLGLLANFSLADYVANGIAFTTPTIIAILLSAGYVFYRQELFPSKKNQKNDAEINSLINSDNPEAAIKILKKEVRRLTFFDALITITLLGTLTLLWYQRFYLNLISLAFLWLTFISFILCKNALRELRKRSKNNERTLYTLISMAFFLFFACILQGYTKSCVDITAEPNTTITYMKGENALEENVYIIRSLSEVIIYQKNSNIFVLNKNNLVSFSLMTGKHL